MLESLIHLNNFNLITHDKCTQILITFISYEDIDSIGIKELIIMFWNDTSFKIKLIFREYSGSVTCSVSVGILPSKSVNISYHYNIYDYSCFNTLLEMTEDTVTNYNMYYSIVNHRILLNNPFIFTPIYLKTVFETQISLTISDLDGHICIYHNDMKIFSCAIDNIATLIQYMNEIGLEKYVKPVGIQFIDIPVEQI